ncbi:DNA (cytosine-5-)-methyltransferase (plasmid) [Methylobacterium aquaticum]|nr:DNA (cytosine-5-)-methyltransferase [Methylobacterium aquaticum]
MVLTQRDWLQVRDAASLLGVSEKTLRNWDKAGKLRPARHPINGYRIYRAADLHELKRELNRPTYFQESLDLGPPMGPASVSTAVAEPQPAVRKKPVDDGSMHWRAEVALDPKHRPQLWNKPSSTVRRDWRKYPQEAHVLDEDCRRYRRLTPSEIAVLQGFDNILAKNTGFSDRQVIAALGNAVPPQMARAVMEGVCQIKSFKKHTSIEVCAGIGGLARGAAEVGFKHLSCLDIDPVCVQFLKRMPELKNSEISSDDLRYARLDRFKGKVGLLSGGPPCQPWSSGGLRRGSEDDRDVLGEMPNLICDIEPECFVFENVAGLTTGQNKSYFEKLMKKLQEPGPALRYGVLAAKLNAADFGVPQVRERVFIIGFRDEPAVKVHRCFDAIWSARTHRDPTISDATRSEWRTVGEAIGGLQDPGGWKSWFGNAIPADKLLE